MQPLRGHFVNKYIRKKDTIQAPILFLSNYGKNGDQAFTKDHRRLDAGLFSTKNRKSTRFTNRHGMASLFPRKS